MDQPNDPTPQTDATAVEEALYNAFANRADFEEVLAEVAADDELHVEHATTFQGAGVMTYNSGVVLGLSDGTEYQITIVQSR